MRNRKLSDAERAERRQADRERLEQAARALLSSEGWQRWVKVRSTQRPLALLVWQPAADRHAAPGRHLRRGVPRVPRSESLRSQGRARHSDPCADERPRARDRDAEPRSPTPTASSQDAPSSARSPCSTSRRPTRCPARSRSRCSRRRSRSRAIATRICSLRLQLLAGSSATRVSIRSLDGSADGWCDSEKHEIVVNEALSANAQVRVLVHEIAHALGVGYQRLRPPACRGARRHGHVRRLRLGRPGHLGLERPLCRRLG